MILAFPPPSASLGLAYPSRILARVLDALDCVRVVKFVSEQSAKLNETPLPSHVGLTLAGLLGSRRI